jgi:hypothetical protein
MRFGWEATGADGVMGTFGSAVIGVKNVTTVREGECDKSHPPLLSLFPRSNANSGSEQPSVRKIGDNAGGQERKDSRMLSAAARGSAPA